MHLLLIHQSFATADDAGGTRHFELARHLIERGDRVTVVGSPVSYLTGRPRSEAPGALPEGLEVRRAWMYSALHRSYLSRLLAFVSFMVSSFAAGVRVRGVDLVWGTTPPIFQCATALILARVKRVPLLLEVRDLWPDFAVETGVLRNPLLIRLSRWLERALYRAADRVIVNSPGFIPHLRACGVAAEKVDLVRNAVETGAFDPAARGEDLREAWGVGGRFIVLYSGAHGLANDLGVVLDAARLLQVYPEIVFVLVGDGKERPALMRAAEQMGLTNIRFIPAQPKARMPAVLAAADVCLATLKPVPMFTLTLPNKVFDYMAAGRPTLLAINGEIRKIVEAADGGRFVPPGRPEALADAVLAYSRDPELRRRQGAAARAYAEVHLDRRAQAAKLREVTYALWSRRIRSAAIKRVVDVVGAVALLVLLSPVFAAVALAVRLTMGRPVLFRQRRLGLRGRPFDLLKFRTMTDAPDAAGGLLPDERRLTRLGWRLRRTTLDEMPELLNVLRGEMSLVGPRPLLPEYWERYSPDQRRRHDVMPGLTGWAQVNGRNALTWEQKFDLDLWYVKHASLWLDLRILAMTAWKVLTREGISQPGHATVEPFQGRRE